MSTWDEIIFKNRNKSYGAYDLRKKYFIGILIAIGVIIQLAFWFALIASFTNNEVSDTNNNVHIVSAYLPKPPMDIEPKEDVLPELKKVRKQEAFTPPKVIENEVETPPDNNQDENSNQMDNNAVSDNGSEYGVLDGEGENSDDAIYVIVEERPMFPGGEKALAQFLQRNIKYPKLAQDHKIQGTIYVSFIVRKDGSIMEAKVIQGLGLGCDEEAVRVLNMMPNWSPGRRKGVSVNCVLQMPIRFVLPVKS